MGVAKNRGSPRFLGHVEMLGNEGEGPFGPFWATQVVFEGQKRERKEAFWAIWVEKGRVTMKIIPFGGLKHRPS